MKGLAVYIHYPFCLSLCPYCDFNVYVKRSIDEAEFIAAVEKEIDLLSQIRKGNSLTSIFFGGGTPSLLSPAGIEKIISALNKKFTFCEGIEISLEANPENASTDYFKNLASLGIGRLSLGVQALDDDALTFLGRRHTKAQALEAIALGQKFFNALSFDLIYARPEQDQKQWQEELKQALRLAPHHLSLYQLETPQGTAFHKKIEQGKIKPLEADSAANLWLASADLCAQYGLYRYEVSNYAKKGFESKHNLSYWLYQDYAGLGPSAHGRLNGCSTQTPRQPRSWERSAHQNTFQKHFQYQNLTALEIQREKIIMGLRLVAGVQKNLFALDEEKINDLVELNLLEQEGGFIKTTTQGALVLDKIIAELV